jgi:Na+-translocating ferredoxin:NAD+ oxidoreductase RnfD subunit
VVAAALNSAEGVVTKHDVLDRRRTALRRFALAITVLNLLGYTVLGFEQAWVIPVVAVATAYASELLLDLVESSAAGRPARIAGPLPAVFDFLLSAHITGLAVSMLLYSGARIWPIVFATVIAIGSKAVFRASVGSSSRHFFNPSNFGITVTLLAFPSVGIAPPYMFTENLATAGDWLLPIGIATTGSLLNTRLTGRLPLILGWLGGFVLQAAVRATLTGSLFGPALGPMTGTAFVLYTFYMVTDPATTPEGRWTQVAFGVSVAAAYGVLMTLHVVFGLFFALTVVCAVRGSWLWLSVWASSRARVLRTSGPVVIVARDAGMES